MYSQLTYTIAQQHHAELIQAAERGRLIADSKAQRPRRQPTAIVNHIRGRITSAVALLALRAERNIA